MLGYIVEDKSDYEKNKSSTKTKTIFLTLGENLKKCNSNETKNYNRLPNQLQELFLMHLQRVALCPNRFSYQILNKE